MLCMTCPVSLQHALPTLNVPNHTEESLYPLPQSVFRMYDNPDLQYAPPVSTTHLQNYMYMYIHVFSIPCRCIYVHGYMYTYNDFMQQCSSCLCVCGGAAE